MQLTFYSYGACKEVTGSKHFIKLRDETIQIDCGMFQGRREETYKKNKELPFMPSDVKTILLSHGHFDHVGALPIVVEKGFHGPIYSTSATRDITNIILMDSAYIQQKDFEYLQNKKCKYPEKNIKLYPPLYSTKHVIKTLDSFYTVNYHKKFSPIKGVEATFYDAGHILGSAMIFLNIENKIKIGFSGDLGRRQLPIIKDPELLPELDYLILEGTYGNRLHKTIDTGKRKIAEIINIANKKNGKIIIPAFAIERTQELIYLIHLLLKEKQIPVIPIFIDSPMAVNATSIFKLHPECFDKETYDDFISKNIDPFGFDNIKYLTSTSDSIAINSLPGPAIIISASGMLESGRILHHLKNNVENSANIIMIVGYMAEHTLGRKLVEGQKKIKIFGKTYQVKAKIETLNALSAHSDYQEIKEWLKSHKFKKIKKIFLVHGEAEALNHLKKELNTLTIKNIEITEYGRIYPLSIPS